MATTPRTGSLGRPPRASLAAETLAELRSFHLGAKRGPSRGSEEGRTLLPAALHPFRGQELRTGWPLALLPDARGRGLAALPLGDFLASLAPAEDAGGVLRDNLPRLESSLRRLAGAPGPALPALSWLAEAAQAVRRELALPAAAAEALTRGLDALLAAVPPDALLLPFGPQAPLHLLALVARARAVAARRAFAAELGELATAGEALLAADRQRRPEGLEDAALGGALGSFGGRLLDPSALAGTLARRRSAPPLPEPRRRELAAAVALLRRFVEGTPSPRLIVPKGTAVAGLEGWPVSPAADPCAAAAKAFEREAGAVAEVLRSVRRLRLEVAEQYDADRHEPRLAAFDWRSFTAAELLLVPPVVAVADEAWLLTGGIASLSRLLLSGQPVQVLLAALPPSAASGAAPVRLEAATLGIAHREAWVQQGSPAYPGALAEGFARAVGSGRPSLHVVAAAPADHRVEPWLAASAAVAGRAAPLLVYDPAAGPSLSRRLSLAGNPEPLADWPVEPLRPAEETQPLPFTFADFALLDPAWDGCVRALAVEPEDEELLPLAEWLALPADEALERIPWTWAVSPHSELVPLAIARPLALAARERLAHWRTLQELAGVRGEALAAAEQRAREAAESAAGEERQRLAAAHAEELARVRAAAGDQAVDRLVSALLGVDVASLPPLPAGAGGAPALPSGDVDSLAAALLAIVGEADENPVQGNGEAALLGDRLLGLLAPPPPEIET
ncbi:MAG TPA: hypothetical protein VMT16_02380 [Thermoanaerobaculia bacterium]|nr:hypothetical protein [Thermoanaerobaculia bacterium]